MTEPVIPIAPDTGKAYGKPAPTHRKELTEVGPGTTMGELLRRYWHPIGTSTDANETSRQVGALGEDLILFRDKSGQPGLGSPHCAHPGTSLYYGKVEERGIRCCYHGWLFDVQGRCLEQPCELQGGPARDKARQPWYPALDLYGLIWAYLVPPEKNRCCVATNVWKTWTRASFWRPMTTALAAAGPRSSPATGCSTTRTWSTRSMS